VASGTHRKFRLDSVSRGYMSNSDDGMYVSMLFIPSFHRLIINLDLEKGEGAFFSRGNIRRFIFMVCSGAIEHVIRECLS
jgi:hypothetical protein